MVSTIDTDIEAGVLRGIRGARVDRWRAIPYAAPPVGELRLRAPQPVQPWQGIRDATRFREAAMQHRGGAQLGPRRFQPTSEDALTLNVTAPTTPPSAPRPVLVFIHGGGYLFGTSALGLYSGSRLALRGDVVFVSCNYRLGAFGYLDFSEFSTPQRQFESNLGLRDQVAVLRWVNDNIAAFGGDPDNVTIIGESAGANAVTTLLATPAAKGLFHRAIAQSSPVQWALTRADAAGFARRCAERLADATGARPRDTAETLHTADARTIRWAVGQETKAVLRERPGFHPVAPVVDGSYLPEAPLSAIAGGRAHPVPLIVGTNRDEATLFAKLLDELPTDPARLEHLFAQTDSDIKDRITAAYPDYPSTRAAVRIGGDYVFWQAGVAACAGHSRHAPTYAYRYDFAPRSMRVTGFGATHGSELFAVFGFGDTPYGRTLTSAGGRRGLAAVTRLTQGHWLHFARTGSPQAGWPPYTEQERSTLIIDAKARVEQDPERERRLAWSGIPSAVLGTP